MTEAETVFDAMAFEKVSRMVMATALAMPAVYAEIEATVRTEVVAQTFPATTLTFKSKKRDSIVITSRGLAKIAPPMLSLENMLVLGINWAGKMPLCHQILSP